MMIAIDDMKGPEEEDVDIMTNEEFPPYHFQIHSELGYLNYNTLTHTHTLMFHILYTACVARRAKASDTQAVGHGFEPRPDQ